MSIKLSLLLIIIASILAFIGGTAYQAWALDRVIKDFRIRLKRISAEKACYEDRRRKRLWEHLAPTRREQVRQPPDEVSGSPIPPPVVA